MTPFVLLAFVMVVLTTAWLTHPLWRPALAARRAGAGVQLPRATLVLGAGLALFVVIVVASGYARLGAAQHLAVAPEASADSESAEHAAAPTPIASSNADALAQAEARISSMVDRLAERLKGRPDDAEGWQMLGRSYAALGKHGQAIGAYETALRLRPDEPTLLAELAFSAAIANRRVGGADSAQLLQRALKLDPRNPKALALAGTLSLERKDYQGAVQYWEQLARNEPADSPYGKQIQASIAQARQLAGSQSALMPVADDALASLTTSTATTRTAAHGSVGGMVTLAPTLRSRVAPDDTLFVFARAVNGSRMPLAVLRKQVKDLPLRFTLDDSLAMSPAAKLSSAVNVVVGARISKSGKAAAQEGDLQGQLPAVALGSTNLKLEISEVVKIR
jgi:cytochrome c-type biogenesis protein CcmH